MTEVRERFERCLDSWMFCVSGSVILQNGLQDSLRNIETQPLDQERRIALGLQRCFWFLNLPQGPHDQRCPALRRERRAENEG